MEQEKIIVNGKELTIEEFNKLQELQEANKIKLEKVNEGSYIKKELLLG